jgi:uncharacterized repeat protein (TIGR03847 family)
MSERVDFDEVVAFTTGAIGVPGQRTFFLQARSPHQVVSVKCEKQQVDALASYLRRLLDDLPDAQGVIHPSLLELEEPVIASWAIGAIGVAYDGENDRLVLQFDELVETDDEGNPVESFDEEHGSLRVRLSRTQALTFCDHAASIVSAGRPPCRFCGEPLDPRGHACVRMN